MNRCAHCHLKGEMAGFSHARTGWPLSRYHKNLDCRACHPSGRKIGRLNRDCVACHDGWAAGTFRHAVTGLVLDEIHAEMDCADCHVDRMFELKPSCANCHDDGRAYPESSPGTLTGKKR
jgi:DnaJ-class molecular chaperone